MFDHKKGFFPSGPFPKLAPEGCAFGGTHAEGGGPKRLNWAIQSPLERPPLEGWRPAVHATACSRAWLRSPLGLPRSWRCGPVAGSRSWP